MIGLAGRLHDLGKVAVPDAVLQKPGSLTDEEWKLMLASDLPPLPPLLGAYALVSTPHPGSLTDEEWKLMRTHPIVGAEVVSRMPALRVLAPIIRAHHERWDGHGYPDGLAGESIPLGARIITVVDAYSAMTTNRPYRKASSPAWALRELQ